MTVWSRSRRAIARLLLASLAAVLVAAPARPAGKATGGTTGAKTPRRTSQALLPHGQPLADTVLALVGPRRTIGAEAFRRGWTQVTPPARADSLTPESARQFLDLLIDKEVLAERATEETWAWTQLESVQVSSTRDRTMMRAALDSALAEAARGRAARGEPKLDADPLGVAVRESTVARLDATYDEALLGRLARQWAELPRPSADSSLWSRLRVIGEMPKIDPADSARVVAWSGVGTYKVNDMLEAWRRLNPLFRPRVETVDQVRDLVKNGLFERALRRHAELHHLDRHPVVVEAVARQREYLAVQHYVSREVYETLPVDSVTLRRFYDRDPAAWGIPTRLSVVRMLLSNRTEGSRMALQLRDEAMAETLVARGRRQGVDYGAELVEHVDSLLFRRAMRSGTGTVLGPDSVDGGWQVVRVNAVLPPQGRAFEVVRELVLRAWSEQESERRLQALLATLRKRTRVVVNDPGVALLVRNGIPAPPKRGRPAPASGRGS